MNSMIRVNEKLRQEMRRACDILRRDNNVGGVMAYIEHIAWLLFLRFLDIEEQRRERETGESNSVLPPDLRWRAWASPQMLEKWDLQNGELGAFVRQKLLPRLAALDGSQQARIISRLFSDESVTGQVLRPIPVCASDYNLKEVISIINEIDFSREDHFFAITLFYEEFLARMGQENQIAGEFHTPRPVIKFMVEVIAPQIGETVYDPACGTGGFLAQSYLYMEKLAQTEAQREWLRHHAFYGQEKKAVVALLGTMNMILHGVSTPNITRANTLEEDMRGESTGRFDVILANPPFGGIEGAHIQANFPIKSNATELLFLQHILKKLSAVETARAGVIVPEGMLFRGGAFAAVKKALLDEFHLFAVISLPPGVFAPYSDVKTAILFFRRASISLLRNPLAREETLYYELPLPSGLKKFSKTNPVLDEHFSEALDLWTRWKAWIDGETERPFLLAREARELCATYSEQTMQNGIRGVWVETLDDLRGRNYDLSARNPYTFKYEKITPPSELIEQITANQLELMERLQRLRKILNDGVGIEEMP